MKERLKFFKKQIETLDDNTRAFLEPELVTLDHILTELERLADLPKYKTNPKDPTQQKILPAYKMEIGYMQQQTTKTRLILSVLNKVEGEEISPLREYLNRLKGRD